MLLKNTKTEGSPYYQETQSLVALKYDDTLEDLYTRYQDRTEDEMTHLEGDLSLEE